MAMPPYVAMCVWSGCQVSLHTLREANGMVGKLAKQAINKNFFLSRSSFVVVFGWFPS